MVVRKDIEIARPPSAVWDFVIDHANDPKWCRKVKTVEATGPASWEVWHKPIPLRAARMLDTTHVRVEQPTLLHIREEDDSSVFNVEYRLKPTRGGTLFTQISDFRWKRFPGSIQRVLAYGVKRDVVAQLRALKRELERG
jgi:uncharacterized protein YndB with AHSA1/START domain